MHIAQTASTAVGRKASVRRRAVALMLAGATLVSCSSDDPSERSEPSATAAPVLEGGTLVIASAGSPTGFNNHVPATVSLVLANIMAPVWPSAFVTTGGGRTVVNGDLLESAELTRSDPQTVVYRINPKAVWSDGDPLDADDFVYQWRTEYTPGAKDVDGSPITTTATDAAGVIRDVMASADKRTVTVVFARPYADWQSLFNLLVPAHIAERVGWNQGFNQFDPAVVVSGGPFRIESYNAGRDLTLVRNERYWSDPSNLDSIVYRFLPDPAQVLAALRNNEADLAFPFAPNPDLVAQARSTPGLRTVVSPLERFLRVELNFRNELLAVPAVRQAIAHAIDRPAIVARTVGQVDPVLGRTTNNRLYAPTEPEYTDTSGGRYDAADPAAARRLLEGAGFRAAPDGVYERDGKRLSFRLVIGPAAVGDLIQAQAKEAGIEMRVEASQNSVAQMAKGDFDLGIIDIFSSTSGRFYVTGGGFNRGQYSNPEVDRLFAEAAAEPDEGRRQALHRRIDTILWDEVVTIPLYQSLGVLVHRDTFTGFEPNPTGILTWNAKAWGRRTNG